MRKFNMFLLFVPFFFVSTLQALDTNNSKPTAFFTKSSQQNNQNKKEIETVIDDAEEEVEDCVPKYKDDMVLWCYQDDE